MKKLTKDELLQLATDVFKHYPGEDELLATTDGNFFLANAANHAGNHARAFGLEVVKIKRSEVLQEPIHAEVGNTNPVESVVNKSADETPTEEQNSKDSSEMQVPAKNKGKIKKTSKI